MMSIKLATDEKIAETSSKGNQQKWKEDGRWYKLDQFGYESLAETFTSRLLEYSNIEKDTQFSFVRYSMAKVNLHGVNRIACVSKDFLKEGQSLITVNALLNRMLGVPLKEKLSGLSSDRKRIAYLVDAVKEYTALERFDQYLTLLFEVDAMVLNDDRHLNNIAVIEENGVYSYCPVFDNGAGLLSNTQILRMDIEPRALIKTLRASPFSMTFNRERNAVHDLFSEVLKMPRFNKKQLKDTLADLLDYYPKRDSDIIEDRVMAVCMR